VIPLGALHSIHLAAALWLLFALYWLVSSFGRKPATRRQSVLGMFVYRLFGVAGFLLLYASDPRLGALLHRFVPSYGWLSPLGVLLTAAGLAFAIWARVHIGAQWSADVEIREDHKLIATGPYARIRHPIYTGILLAMLGTALIVGEYRGLLGVLVCAIGFWIKGRMEERLLEQEFGAEYAAYRRRTGFYLPWLGRQQLGPGIRETQSSSSV
jgi:protein-S-isoprenylcysteine O-methyltransferase Ste14